MIITTTATTGRDAEQRPRGRPCPRALSLSRRRRGGPLRRVGVRALSDRLGARTLLEQEGPGGDGPGGGCRGGAWGWAVIEEGGRLKNGVTKKNCVGRGRVLKEREKRKKSSFFKRPRFVQSPLQVSTAAEKGRISVPFLSLHSFSLSLFLSFFPNHHGHASRALLGRAPGRAAPGQSNRKERERERADSNCRHVVWLVFFPPTSASISSPSHACFLSPFPQSRTTTPGLRRASFSTLGGGRAGHGASAGL